mgnify:FL=1
MTELTKPHYYDRPSIAALVERRRIEQAHLDSLVVIATKGGPDAIIARERDLEGERFTDPEIEPSELKDVLLRHVEQLDEQVRKTDEDYAAIVGVLGDTVVPRAIHLGLGAGLDTDQLRHKLD